VATLRRHQSLTFVHSVSHQLELTRLILSITRLRGCSRVSHRFKMIFKERGKFWVKSQASTSGKSPWNAPSSALFYKTLQQQMETFPRWSGTLSKKLLSLRSLSTVFLSLILTSKWMLSVNTQWQSRMLSQRRCPKFSKRCKSLQAEQLLYRLTQLENSMP
jgi:hypothetical protein